MIYLLECIKNHCCRKASIRLKKPDMGVRGGMDLHTSGQNWLGGCGNFFHVVKTFWRNRRPFFFFCSPPAKFLEFGGVYTPLPQRKKRAHVWKKPTPTFVLLAFFLGLVIEQRRFNDKIWSVNYFAAFDSVIPPTRCSFGLLVLKSILPFSELYCFQCIRRSP
jgi:hypothetical protein